MTSGAAGLPPRRKVFNSTNQNSPFGRLWRPLAIGYESAGALRDLGTLYGPPSEPPCRIRKFGDVRKVVRSVGFRPFPLSDFLSAMLSAPFANLIAIGDLGLFRQCGKRRGGSLGGFRTRGVKVGGFRRTGVAISDGGVDRRARAQGGAHLEMRL